MGNFIDKLKVFFNVLSECQFKIETPEVEQKFVRLGDEPEDKNVYKTDVDKTYIDKNNISFK